VSRLVQPVQPGLTWSTEDARHHVQTEPINTASTVLVSLSAPRRTLQPALPVFSTAVHFTVIQLRELV
jgi:hypothetical protein